MFIDDTRHADVVRLLIKYPQTAEMIYRSSANFKQPFAHDKQVSATLKALTDEGYLNRQPIPTISTGNKPYLYFLKNKAARIAPEVKSMKQKTCLFRGFCSMPWHTLAASEVMSHFERSVGQVKDRVKILASLRDRHFRASVEVRTVKRTEQATLIPDYTHIVEIEGTPNLLFFEIQNEGAVINPIDPHSITRSFKYKLAKYKAFQNTFRGHRIIAHLEKVLRHRFKGFRVFVISTRTEENKRNLLEAAGGYKTLFYFSTLAEISNGNMFSDPVWELPNGSKRGIFDLRKI